MHEGRELIRPEDEPERRLGLMGDERVEGVERVVGPRAIEFHARRDECGVPHGRLRDQPQTRLGRKPALATVGRAGADDEAHLVEPELPRSFAGQYQVADVGRVEHPP